MVFGDPRKICLVIQDLAEAFWKMVRRIEELSDRFSGFVHNFIVPNGATFESAHLREKINRARLEILALISVYTTESRNDVRPLFANCGRRITNAASVPCA